MSPDHAPTPSSPGPVAPLPPEALYTVCPPDRFDFETTAELDGFDPLFRQVRAAEAVQFGIGIGSDGYNIFAHGPQETDKEDLVRFVLEDHARSEDPPADWCYLFNFEQPHAPKALELPHGTSAALQEDMRVFVDELQPGLSSAFESEEYQTRRHVIEMEFQEEHEKALMELQQRAQEKGIAFVRTPTGFLFVPMKDGDVMPPKEIQNLDPEVRKGLEEEVEELQERLLRILRQVPTRQRDLRERLRELNQEIARFLIHDLLAELRTKYAHLDQVLAYLDAVEQDIVDNVRGLMQSEGEGTDEADPVRLEGAQTLRRYYVNALVRQRDGEGAPVVYEDHPTLINLIGRVEYRAHMGTLVTDFTLIRPGALHRANGGYLLLDARKVLMQPYAWEALKRALRSGEIRIQSPSEEVGLVSTLSLEPEPIPLRVKVVLLGDRSLYYLLALYDPEFAELFRVEADFDEQIDRTAENERYYALLIGAMARQAGVRPLDREAVARVIEHGARMAADAEKLSTETRTVRDLLREADYWAGQASRTHVSRDDVEQALEARRRRSGRIRERMQESILRNTLFIDTEGAVVGQINGLSVLQLSQDTFGRPSRITARVRLGTGNVVDIEREVELGGPIHSKGVLILSSFLASRYADEHPLSLSASLVFEQSYGGIDGDSASSAELYTLLSAIAEVPLKQSLAVTGSVNQHGQIQPIGGVNEKIEGFFDICRARGLTGDQGVLIPASNVKHLMLRREVVEAVAAGTFHVYPVETIDQGLALLTGVEVGGRKADGTYPEGTLNARIEARLQRFARERKAFHATTDGETNGKQH